MAVRDLPSPAFAGELLGRDDLYRAYRGTEFEQLGTRLRSLNPEDRGYEGDREAVDAWAEELGLNGWYEWGEHRPRYHHIK
jgi:hypothetical protein